MEVRYFFKTRDVPFDEITGLIIDSTKYFHRGESTLKVSRGSSMWTLIIYDSEQAKGIICIIHLHSHYNQHTAQQWSNSYESNYDNSKDMIIYHTINELITEEIQRKGIEIE